MGFGFWLKGDIRIDVSTSSHVRAIIDNPELFQTSKEHIKNTYRKYREPLGLEGKARADLVREAISHGFIRVRHYEHPYDKTVIQFSEWNEARKYVIALVDWLIISKLISPEDEVWLQGFQDGYHEKMLVKKLLNKEQNE